VRFEKGLRSVSLKALPLGYGAPPTDDFLKIMKTPLFD